MTALLPKTALGFTVALQDTERMFTQTHSSIQLLQVLYIYSAAADTFLQVPDMPAEIPEQICAALTELQAVEKGYFFLPFCCASPAFKNPHKSTAAFSSVVNLCSITYKQYKS